MLDKIIRFSIMNKLIIGIFTLGLIVWGGYSVTQLSIDAVPDITNNQVQVITTSPSLAAQEVERLITFPVEIAMANIPGLIEIRSFSRFGLSVVTIVFKDDIDVYWARQQVTERLTKALTQIPPGVGIPELAPVSTGLGEIYQYVIHPKKGFEKKYTATDLRTIQDWIVRRQLLGTPGIADVSSFGGYLKQYEIAVQSDKLRSMNISISDIFTALNKNNQNTGGAYIDKKPNAYFIRSQGLISSIADIEKIVIKSNDNGTPVFMRDVAKVQFGHAVRYGAMTRNTEGEVVGALVLMLKGANSSKVIKAVKEKMAIIEKTLPEGLVIEPFLDRTKLVNNAIGTVAKNLAEGALIVIFVLVLLLGNLRAGLIVASVIPLAMLFAIAMMNLFGVSGNLMSLGAIDFGLIIDGAIIIVEATMHHIVSKRYTHRLSQAEMDGEVYESASKIRSSAAFGEIIILIVYIPILALTGIEGKMFGPMAQTVVFAILGAFILSITYVPMISALALSKQTEHKKNISDKIIDFFQRCYDPLIHFALKRKAIVVVSSLILLVFSVWVFSGLGGEFIPQLDEGDFAVETRVMTGSSLSETIDAATKASGILLKNFPEIKQIVAKIGSAEIPTDPMPVEACDLMIILKDKSEWTSAETRAELAENMSQKLEAIPGVSFGFQQPIQMRFNELMTGARQDVALKLYGEDLDVLTEFAGKIGNLIKPVAGAQDLYVEEVTGLPQIVIKFDRDKIAQFGLNIEDINTAIRTGFAGETAGLVFEGEKRFDLVVRLDTQSRQTLENVKGLFITTSKGMQVPLEQLADIEFKIGPNQIQRDDTKRRITVGFNVRNRDVESIVKEIQQKIDAQIKLPAGYYVTYGGQFQNLVEAKGRLAVAVPVALLLIFVLLYFTFHSIKQSLLIFTAIPLSAIGGIFALWLRDMPFSISAGVGFIALFGVAVLNGIVLIGEFNSLKKQGLTDIKEIILSGTTTRLRPVIITAMVASLGFLPMALSTGSGAEVQKPLATVVIGGLISATLLTLLVLPVLYYYLENGFRKIKIIPIAILLLIASNVDTNAQTYNLDQAIQVALQNNRSIKSANINIDYQQSFRKSATDIGKTNVVMTYGQYNNFNQDNNFTISQTIPFPTALANQSSYANSLIKSSEIRLSVTKSELINSVKLAYFQIAFFKAKEKLLREQLTIFENFEKASNVRYRTGEANLLEKATATSQAFEIRTLQLQNLDDIKIEEYRLQMLLNSSTPTTITDTNLQKRELSINYDSTAMVANPNLRLIKQQIEVSQKAKEVEQSRLLPDIQLGYFNQSLIGYYNRNGVETFYDGNQRFQGVILGLAIPIWIRPQVARIKSAELAKQIAQSNSELLHKNLSSQLSQSVQQYEKYKRSLDYYEKNALPQADLILDQAQKSFKAGAIGYMEYFQALNRALTIKNTYLDNLNLFNIAVLNIEFLVGNN